MKTSKVSEVIELIRRGGILRPRDLDVYSIPREYFRRLYREGLIDKIGRGLYTLRDLNITEHHSLVEACKKFPMGLYVCCRRCISMT